MTIIPTIIASYPRSGSTWLRFLLHAYFYRTPPTPERIAASIPDLHDHGANLDSPRFVKTHESTDRFAHYRAIHLVRQPRDVALSCWNYYLHTGVTVTTQVGELTLPDYLYDWSERGGCPIINESFGMPTWRDHTRAWLAHPHTLLVRYEDMLAWPRQQLRNILSWSGDEPNDEMIDYAIAQSTIERMRRLEQQGHDYLPHREKPLRPRAPFVGLGKTGQSLDHVHAGLDEAFEAAFADEVGAVYGVMRTT